MTQTPVTTDNQLGVNFVIIKQLEHETLVVLQKRDANSRTYQGCWCIPGGGLEASDNEDYLVAASREAFEETGLLVETTDWQTLCIRPPDNPGKVVVALVPATATITRCEGALMEWKSLLELDNLIMANQFGYKQEIWLIPTLKAFLRPKQDASQ